MRCLVEETAWQATQVFDPALGQSLPAYVRGRVLAAALAHYRREWTYAFHTALNATPLTNRDAGVRAAGAVLDEELHCALTRLPETDRWILEQLCVLGRTEEEVAGEVGLSHQAVSLRKRRALAQLRMHLSESDE